MPQQLKTDKTLFATTVIMVFFGLVMIYSASSVMAMEDPRYHSTTYFVLRQAIWVLPALLVMMFFKRLRYLKLQNPMVAFPAIGLMIILLLVVYFSDPKNHRWLRLGILNIQPSEIAKPAIVIFLAYFVTQRARAINSRHTIWPAIMSVGLLTFGVAVADLGTAVVIGVTGAVVFFVAGLQRRYCAVLLAAALLGGSIFIASKPYRLIRVVQFFDPGYKITDQIDTHGYLRGYLSQSMAPRDANYQLLQAQIAVASGGPLGLGPMQGKQKLLYLPEPHTDCIYAVICEEMGMFGSLGVLAAFCMILWRGLRATFRVEDEFGRYLALGITTMVVVQAFMNMSVVLGLAPTKGIPLPMLSFGGNSLLSTLALLGMLMNVSENA
ncbi:MAG: putative peptidoglycan glycosyltransferase FtsW [Bryobacteraceae bacterium]